MPTRGTTYLRHPVASQTAISIHVPTRGTTQASLLGALGVDISIHVPTRGTTIALGNFTSALEISIHVPTRGTTIYDGGPVQLILFQSTCPRGARQHPLRHLCPCWNFNPRAHEGHDALHGIHVHISMISIHVPTRGTTQAGGSGGTGYGISIHVPTRGTTQISVFYQLV